MNYPQNQNRGVPQQGQQVPPQGGQVPQPGRFAPGRPAVQPAQNFPPQAPFQQPAQPTFQPQQRPAFRGQPQAPQQNQGPPVARNTNPFAGIQQAKAQRNDNYIRTGTYIVKFEKTNHFIGYNDKLNKLALELSILGIVAPAEDGRTHFVGEQVTHLLKENPQYPNYFLAETKAIVAAMLGCPEEAVDDNLAWETLCDNAQQPLAGLVAEVYCWHKQGSRQLMVKKNYRRRVLSHEIPSMLAPEVVARFFPGDTLQRMAQAEQMAAQAPQAFDQQQLPPPPQGFYQPPQQ